MNTLELNRLVVRTFAVALAIAAALGAIWGVADSSIRIIDKIALVAWACGIAYLFASYGFRGKMPFSGKATPWWNILFGGSYALLGVSMLTRVGFGAPPMALGIGFVFLGGMHVGIGVQLLRRSSAA